MSNQESGARREAALRHVHRAFERGRVFFALRAIAPLTAWAMVAIVVEPDAGLVAFAFVAVGGVCAWRGGSCWRGAVMGSLGGFVGWTTALSMRAYAGEVGCASCYTPGACVLTCIAISVAAGALIGTRARRERDPLTVVAAAIVFAVLAGLMVRSATGPYAGSGVMLGYAAGALATFSPRARSGC